MNLIRLLKISLDILQRMWYKGVESAGCTPLPRLAWFLALSTCGWGSVKGLKGYTNG